MATLYIATYNHDYEESAYAFTSRPAAVAHIAETFECEAEHDTPAFWQEVNETYGEGKWKGLMFFSLDTVSLKIKQEEW